MQYLWVKWYNGWEFSLNKFGEGGEETRFGLELMSDEWWVYGGSFIILSIYAYIWISYSKIFF